MTPEVPETTGGSARPPRVLAVDDQPANLLLLRRILTPAGFEVLEARSGAEALAIARDAAPDLILLDMHLPDIHGLEVLRRLRETSWGPGLPVVAMSALSSPEDERAWLRAGCVGCVEKPVTVRTFVQTISQWLPGGSAPSASPDAPGTGEDRLGEILLTNRLVTAEQLAGALAAKAGTGRRLGQVLLDRGAISQDDLAWALSTQLGYPYVYLTPELIDAEAARLLPEALLRERSILPILMFGGEMTLAMADPTDQRTIDDVSDRTRLRVKRALALHANITAMLDRLFSAGPPPAGAGEAEAQHLQFHLVQALQQGATEIHFDPTVDGQARIRYRLHGTLVDRAGLPAELHTALVTHLRSLVGLPDRDSGHAGTRFAAGGAEIYLEAALQATTAGPAAALSLYPVRTEMPDPVPLGLAPEILRRLREILGARRGVVLVGCGDRLMRSTLLHALLPPVQRGKTWCLETLPVHLRPALNQTVLATPTEAAGRVRTVAAAQADLILLDDASDGDALRAVLEAGQTRVVIAGHPADDLPSLVSLALDGAGPGLVASGLRAVLAAQTVRLLCSACRQVAPGNPPEGGPQTFIPQGCEMCGFTGFRGQRVLTAFWEADREVRAFLRAGRRPAALDRVAAQTGTALVEGSRALLEDGMTSAEELSHLLEPTP